MKLPQNSVLTGYLKSLIQNSKRISS